MLQLRTQSDTEKQNDVVTVSVAEEKTSGGIGEVIKLFKVCVVRKLLRATCFVRRFVENLKPKQMGIQDYKEICR